MKGRKENEEKTKIKIKILLKDNPRYLGNYYKTINTLSYTTQKAYLLYVIEFIQYIENEYGLSLHNEKGFKHVKVSMIKSYIQHIGTKNNGEEASYSVVLGKFYGVKNFFNFLVNDEYLEYNPCNKVTMPKDKSIHKIVSLEKEEINIIKENIMNGVGNEEAIKRQKKWRNRDLSMIMLGLSLGLRVTSISEINVEDINFENNSLQVIEKGDKPRELIFSDNMKSVLLDWMADREELMKASNKQCDALFITYQIKRIQSRGISRVVEKYTYNIDKHITPHKLRSTCATLTYNEEKDIYLVADKLGHSNVATTKRYIQIDEERKKKAASAMDKFLF